MILRKVFTVIFFLLIVIGCDDDENRESLSLLHVFVGTVELSLTGTPTTGLPADQSITLVFSAPVDQQTKDAVSISAGLAGIPFNTSSSGANSLTIFPSSVLQGNTEYTIAVSQRLKGVNGQTFSPLTVRFKTAVDALSLSEFSVGSVNASGLTRVLDVPRNLSVKLTFSAAVNEQTLRSSVGLSGSGAGQLLFSFSNGNRTVDVTSAVLLRGLTRYVFSISASLTGTDGGTFPGLSVPLYTAVDPAPKFPLLTDGELLTLVQQQTFRYFWDFAHPASGMARERNTSGDLVTTGGTGFGLMSLLVGIERGFISRQQGTERLAKVLSFLELADRFHGAWPHWLNGNTGKVIPFSADDNGGDLVETSFLVQGLLAFRQYLRPLDPTEALLISRINRLWEGVEWNWYRRGEQNVLYWHWSPDKGWAMNMKIQGHNETLITYILAAASPTHPIDAGVYTNGYARNGAIVNGKSFLNIPLPLGEDFGGPLFFAHYSFLGLDPRALKDKYTAYWTQNINHSRINHAYCAQNPKRWAGYSDESWGLTASDNHLNYSAHSPLNDIGVISPTAALSSFPYTPVESMKALKFFYYTLGDRLWGNYGFYDAFNATEGWVADSFLAIDQGPIIVMIENHRTGLLWNLFMSAPEVKAGLQKLEFEF